MDKDLRKIVKALEAQGFEVEATSRGHLVVTRDAS
jgi:biotin operon repressor